MESETRPRVPRDTRSTRWGGALALALVLHAPLSPLAGLLGLLQFLGTETEVPPAPPVTEIPLDILEDDDLAKDGKPADTPPSAEPTPPSEPEVAAPVEPTPVVKPKKPKQPPPDAGAPEPEDAGAPDAAKGSDAGAADDAGKGGDAGPTHKPGEGIGSPVAGLGDKRIVDPNANVQLLVHNDRVRRHPLGGRIGPLLRNVYQWRDFFGPTAIDPIRDIDRMLIVGPQLRDSRQVIAILQFNLPQERVRAAVDALVSQDPEGGWLDAGVPVARARADRGERVFVFPSKQVLVVTPPSAQASAERLPRNFKLPAPKGEEIALANLATPWRAFLGLPVVIPKSIRSAQLRLSAREDGGIVIDLLAHDETEPLARSDAQALASALAAATSIDLGLFGAVLFGSSQKKFIEKGSFEADGSDIRGEIVLTRSQVETLLELAGGFLSGGRPSRPLAPAQAPSVAPGAKEAPAPAAPAAPERAPGESAPAPALSR